MKKSGFKMNGFPMHATRSAFRQDENKPRPTREEITQVQNLLDKMEMNPGSYPIPPNIQAILDKYPGFSWGESESEK